MKAVALALLGALAPFLAARAAAAEDYPLPPPPSSSSGSRVDYSADKADYDAERSMLHLSGNVVVTETTMTVKGQDLWIDTARRSGRSDGPLFVENGFAAVYGDSGTFDFADHTGHLAHSSTGEGYWRIHAREAFLEGNGDLMYRGASFTSCEEVPPDYHFRASKVVVVPKKHLTATNVVFFLGDAPLFYTPFLYEPLTPLDTYGWRSQPGLDNRNGAFLKNTQTTMYSTSTYSKLYADYYSKEGFGYGGELERHQGENSRGALFGYRIHELSTGADRWGLFGQGFQALPSSSAFQGRFQLQTDPNFNNDYNRSSVFRVTPNLTDNAAFVHRFSNGTERLSYARFDVADGNGFMKSTEDAPRLDYLSTPMRVLNLPWLNTFSGFADNNYTAGRPYIQKSVDGGWEGARAFVLGKGVSFEPKLDYTETYYNKFTELRVNQSSMTVYDGSFGRWSTAGDLRWKSPAGQIDAAEAYTQRLKPDDFTQDTAFVDKGVEQNLATLTDLVLPLPRVWAQFSTGYDFRTFRDHTTGFRDRVQPFVAQTDWHAANLLEFTVRDDYQLDQRNRALLADARWGDMLAGPSAGGGFSYNISTPGDYYANTEFAFAPFAVRGTTPTWRVAFVLRALVDSEGGIARAHGLRLFEKEIVWTRRWHDFYTKLGYRARPGGVGEETVHVELKVGPDNSKQAPRRDWESEWFPERASSSDDLRP